MIRLVKVLRTLEGVIEKGVDANAGHKVSFLVYIYDKLKAKGIPNVDHLTRTEMPCEDGPFIELEPQGDSSSQKSADNHCKQSTHNPHVLVAKSEV